MIARTDVTILNKLLRSNKCELVSLGHNCDVAHLLRYSGLRRKAYPFDWCITPIESIVKLIENDFHDFINVENLTFSEPHKALVFEGEGGRTVESDKMVVTAYCSKYSMSFPHDFSDDHDETYCKVAGKYHARVDRLICLMKSDRDVIFVVNPEVGVDYEGSIERLGKSLAKKYPSLRFHICHIDDVRGLINASVKRSFFVMLNRKVQRVSQMVRRIFN